MKNRLFIVTGIVLLAILGLIVNSYKAEHDKKRVVPGVENAQEYESNGFTEKDAKKYGIRLVRETIPTTITVDGITIDVDSSPKTVFYPDKLPILGVERKQFTEKDVLALFKSEKIKTPGTHHVTQSSDSSLPHLTYTKWPISGDLTGTVSANNYENLKFSWTPRPYPDVAQDDLDGTSVKKRAVAFINKHGGLPDDAERWIVRVGTRRHDPVRGRGDMASAALVLYRHRYKGIPVNDDSILVALMNGVTAYERRWHTLTPGTDLRIIGPRSAIEYLLHVNKYRIVKERPTIPLKIRLIYYDPKLCKNKYGPGAPEQVGLRPGWFIENLGTTEYVIDAFEGTVYEWKMTGTGGHIHNMYRLCN